MKKKPDSEANLDPLTEVQKEREAEINFVSAPLPTSTSPTLIPAHKFPYKTEIGKKIVLWKGDICLLNSDAIVNSTNESMTEATGLAGEILEKGGPELKAELTALESCRTGEAKITKAYNLPSRFIIHTVGPRYNEKYKTAAENALHNCYRSCLQLLKENNLKTIAYCVVNSEKRGYPSEGGAHIAIRTVRRFLEKWGEDIEKVIFCMSREEDYNLYQKVMPLYCPRSEEEAKNAHSLLPRDTGNEFGETVIEERKIRISAFPSIGLDSTGDHEYYSSLDDSKPEVSLLSSMQGDPDEDRRKRVAAKSRAEREADEAARLYRQYLAKAKKTDLSDIARLNLLYHSGVDTAGRPIMVFVASRLPENNNDALERVFLYIIKLMDQIANKEYIVVYLHTNMGSKSKPDFSWLKRMYNTIDAKYGKNLRSFYVLHPSFWLKLVQSFFSTFSNSEFWTKVRYVERLMDLYEHIDHDQLKIPDDIYKHDHAVNGSPYTSTSVPRRRDTNSEYGENL